MLTRACIDGVNNINIFSNNALYQIHDQKMGVDNLKTAYQHVSFRHFVFTNSYEMVKHDDMTKCSPYCSWHGTFVWKVSVTMN